jgi:hypothetical protein
MPAMPPPTTITAPTFEELEEFTLAICFHLFRRALNKGRIEVRQTRG